MSFQKGGEKGSAPLALPPDSFKLQCLRSAVAPASVNLTASLDYLLHSRYYGEEWGKNNKWERQMNLKYTRLGAAE